MKEKIVRVLSYVLVAALASAVSCGLMAREVKEQNTKLNQLSQLIEERFIEDVDMAEEMSEYTQKNVLSQAGTSMLAQANQQPQTILSLLQG